MQLYEQRCHDFGMQSLVPKAQSWPLLQQTIVCDRETQTVIESKPLPDVDIAVQQPVRVPKKQFFSSRKLLQRHYYPEGSWGWVIIFCGTCIHILNHGLQLSFSICTLFISARYQVSLTDTGQYQLIFFNFLRKI